MSEEDEIFICPHPGCDGNHIPNEETARALEESMNGIGVKSFTSMEELFKDLGI